MRRELQSKLVHMATVYGAVAFLWDGYYTRLSYSKLQNQFSLYDDEGTELMQAKDGCDLIEGAPDNVEIITLR